MRYQQIVYNDLSNGESMRISYFCQGCSIHCKNCFNTKLQDFNGGYEFTKDILNESLDIFEMFYSGYDGITLIGGECMDNLEFSNLIASEFKKRFPHKTIWLYSGYTYEEIISDRNKLNLLSKCDVLVDGKFENDKKDLNLKYRGSSNQRLVDVKKSLISNKYIKYEVI